MELKTMPPHLHGSVLWSLYSGEVRYQFFTINQRIVSVEMCVSVAFAIPAALCYVA